MSERPHRHRSPTTRGGPSLRAVAPLGTGLPDPGWSEGELLRAVIAGSPVALYVVDADGIVQMWNPAAERLFGWSAAEALGQRLPFVGAESDPEFARLRRRALEEGGFSGIETVRRRKDGTAVEVSISTVPLRDANGAASAILGVSQDVTARNTTSRELLHQARYDSLTGLVNRRFFLEAVREALHRARPSAKLVYLDLDDFKDINDTYGHHVGDELLAAFGGRLSGAVRDRDVVGRLGGDEFAILLRDARRSEAEAAVQRVFDALQRPFVVADRELRVRASAGMAACGRGCDAQEVLRRADVALYEAKRLARGGCKTFDKDMHEAVVRRVGLEADLHRAARRGQLLLDYQPILEVGTASLLGFEALVRWLHPERGLLPPGQFIPIAEESGAIVEIGRWVLREACAQLSRWQACGSGLGSTVMSVNLSVGQLQSPGLVGDVVEALAGAGLRASQLQLEVTETLLAAERSTVAALRSLDRVGVRLAIDDFGTGYASLSSLRSLPFKVLKVDRSFVAGIGSSQQDAAIVAATLGLGQALGLQTVAEGVETARQLEFLELHGCDAAQGYLLGKPQAPARLAGLLRTRQAPGRAEHAPEASTPGADPAITLPGPPDSGSPGPPGSGSGLQLLDDPVHHHSEEASGRAQ